ncbi:MAG: YihY/virulence factor BrkB family protein [Spirochaetaceae bacterium]
MKWQRSDYIVSGLDFIKEGHSRVWGTLSHLYREVINDHCLLRASSLAFSTLLALVPLTAFVFSLFTGFGAFQDVQMQFRDLLVRFLVPTHQEELLRYIDVFIANARTMGVVGLLLFALTSIFLLNGITQNINAVWGSSSKLAFMRKLSLYFSVIVFGTLIISTGFSFTRTIKIFFSDAQEISELFSLVVRLGPSITFFIILWMIIYTIPSAKVRLSSSILGAFFGTILWELARFAFVDGTNYILRMSVIYGSIAYIPIFLVWLSIQWLVILVAVEISYIHQYRSYRLIQGKTVGAFDPYRQIHMGLRLYLLIARRFYQGEEPFSIRSLAHKVELSPNDTEFFLSRFQKSGLITYTHSGPSVVTPMKEPAVTEFREVLEALYGYPLSTEDAGGRYALGLLEKGTESFHGTTVLDIISSTEIDKESNNGQEEESVTQETT